MRAWGYFGLVAIGVGLAGGLRADPGQRVATIDTDEVEVRAGNAMGYPATGKLRKGDRVIVVREEETGFLAIQPPPGTVSWVKQIHLAKVEAGDGGRVNVTVLVEGAEVMAGAARGDGPTNKVTMKLPKGAIVEVTGPSVRIDHATWFPVVPPDGDLRWISKSVVRKDEIAALAGPSPYRRPDPPAFSVGAGPDTKATTEGVVRPAVATLPRVLSDHALWAKAGQAERSADYATARHLYAQIYKDLWDTKAERDAIVICYNRYTRADEMLKSGSTTPSPRTESRRDAPVSREREPEPAKPAPEAGKWKSGYLQELQKVFVDNKPVFALQDEKGNVTYYVTAIPEISLKNYAGRRVSVLGMISERPELYRPHLAVEKIEVAK